jgi:hydrogenase maturation protease
LAARIIGVGNEWAGDDAVGIAVVRKVREFNGQVDLAEVNEPTQLIELLTGGADPVILIDALLDDGPAGRVVLIDPGRHNPLSKHLLSTHGVGVMEAVELARIAHSDRIARRILIIGITVQRTSSHGRGLSAEVEAAVSGAARQALGLVGDR